MDLSCDYLIDITGLTDVPKEVYSCARQDGACENKNCPAAQNFEKKSSDYKTTIAENPTGIIDYKFCPMLTAGYISAPARPDTAEEMKTALECHGPRCAWWDADKSRCAVLSIARNK